MGRVSCRKLTVIRQRKPTVHGGVLNKTSILHPLPCQKYIECIFEIHVFKVSFNIIILSLVLPSSLFSSALPAKHLYNLLISHMYAACLKS
jgi:hypothetical protein